MEALHHPQALQLLGRYCVFPGLRWHLRQHAAADTVRAQGILRQAMERWVGCLTGRPAGIGLPGDARRQVRIPSHVGGLGVADATAVAPLAHVAGWAATAAIVVRLAPALRAEVETGLLLVEG